MFQPIKLKNLIKAFFILGLLSPIMALCQYTDVINSNRPGLSVSAYAIGKGVVQAELGFVMVCY